MTIENTYSTIAGWLNSAITDEQIDLCVDCARLFLVTRHGAYDEYYKIVEAAKLKKNLPATVINY